MAVDSVRAQKPLLLAFCLIVLVRLLTLGLYPLTDTTEARYAEVARKMVELGDWITPWYDYGVPFWAKPPLSTWATALSFKLLGFNEFAARMPHFLLALGATWLVWDLARRRSAQEACLALVLLWGSVLFFVAAGAVMTDMALAFALTLAMRGFWLGQFASSVVERRRHAWLAYFGLGLGLLAKGPIALVLVFLPLGMWAVLTRRVQSMWSDLPWIKGGGLALLVAVPWYFLAEAHTPGFLDYFLVGEHWYRFTTPGWTGDRYGTAHAFPRGSIWIFAAAALLPWTFLLPWVLLRRRRVEGAKTEGHWYLYLASWGLAPVVFFTVSGNVIWTYVLPGLPSISLLLAALIGQTEWFRTRPFVIPAMGLLMTAIFCGLLAQRAITGEWKSAKEVVIAFQRLDRDRPLAFLGKRTPYSGDFYNAGKAIAIDSVDGLPAAARIHNGLFLATTADQVDWVRKVDGISVKMEGTFGAYVLMSVTPVGGSLWPDANPAQLIPHGDDPSTQSR